MEIFELLESLEDIIERSRNLPFSAKGIVDKDEILDLIKEIRLKHLRKQRKKINYCNNCTKVGFDNIDDDVEKALREIKRTFTGLLVEFYQVTSQTDSCIEINWVSQPESNQSYHSKVNIYMTIRITDINQVALNNRIQAVDRVIKFSLEQAKFQIACVDYPLANYLNNNYELNCVKAVRKKEDLLYMQNGIMNSVYVYDVYNDVSPELDNIVNIMMNSSNAIISLQLFPVRLFQEEQYYFEKIVNNLSSLANGISIPQYGFMRDGLAEEPLKMYSYYLNHINQGLFLQNLTVIGSTFNANNLASKVLIECTSKNSEGKIPRFEIVDLPNQIDTVKNYPYLYPWIISDVNLKTHRLNVVLDRYNSYLYRIANLVTPDEASTFFRFPIGTKKITGGIEILDIEKRTKTYTEGILNTSDIILGRLQNIINNDTANLGFNLKDLTKHMLVVGTPGSGKSTFLVGLMDRLWKEHHIPFLVIEPAKTEYRSLIDSIDELQIFSPGKNNVAPYILNPFVPPKGVPLEVYKSIVKAAFSVAFEMWTPLDQLFDETLNICYSDCGWLDETTIEDGRRVFTLSDFIETYRKVVNSKGYTGEYKKQVETAGVMRLQGLLEQNINIFDNINSVSIEDILTKPTVIELSNVKDIKQKSFIIALLLNNIYAYAEANLRNDGQLKNVILLEEAHVLLSGDNVSTNNESSSANAQAVKLLAGMLAEIRSRGVGIVIADQSSRKVSSDVISNTNIKVMFRLVEATDKEIVMNSTVMNKPQFDRLAKLRTGQALVYFDKLDETEEIELDDYRLNHNITTDLSDQAVKSRMHYWDTRQALLIPYEECVYLPECKQRCNFEVRSKARVIADRIFRKYFENLKSIDEFKKVYYKINTIIEKETLEIFDKSVVNQIRSCVKVHVLRKTRFYTNLGITRKMCISTIKSLNQGGHQ